MAGENVSLNTQSATPVTGSFTNPITKTGATEEYNKPWFNYRAGVDKPQALNTTEQAPENKEIADTTNAYLQKAGYSTRVTPVQVAQIDKGMTETVMPGIDSLSDYSTAMNISNPKGPFAELYC